MIAQKPLIKQGWLRVLLLCVFYFILLIVASLLVNNYVKSKKGSDIKNLNELLNGEFLWISLLSGVVVALLAVFLFRKFIDRKSFMSLGLGFSGHANDAISGFLLAPIILGIGTIILHVSGHLQWVDVTFDGNQLFISLGMVAIVALYEEIMFRGYILNNLMQSFNKWVALIISALLFAVFHMDNPSANIIPLLNIFLAGILLGLNYVYTKNLWFAIMLHFSWDFFEGPIFGYKVSGLNLQSLLQTEMKGDVLLTGGDFGFEASIFDLALSVIAILVLYMVFEKKLLIKPINSD